MHIFEMEKEDFKKLPKRGEFLKDVGEFYSLVIIPQDCKHDSDWMCMDFVAVNKEGEPICRLSGCSDVLHLDGIGGYGYRLMGDLPSAIEPKGWKIDCLPCGYLRVFSHTPLIAGPPLSDFEIYAKERHNNGS